MLPPRPILGIKIIDEEHRDFLLFMSQIETEHAHGAKIAFALMQYSMGHFDNEESLMRERSYPGLEAHIFEHRRLTEVLRLAINVKGYLFTPKMVKRFRLEFLAHIAKFDQMWADWAKPLIVNL